MNRQALQLTLRELQALARRPRLWMLFAIIVALFAITGPFGTFDRMPGPLRFFYWLFLQGLAWLCALFCIVFAKHALAGRIEPSLLRFFIGATISAAPIGGVISLANAVFLGDPLLEAPLLGNMATALPVSLSLAAITWMTLDGEPAGEDASSGAADGSDGDAAPSGAPALLERLPMEKRGALVRLEVQDHYVLVVTETGREMLLMRLADAIREAGAGMQVHRSHWVAFDAVERLEREGGRNPRLSLVMSDGFTAPVSRSYAAAVRDRFG